MHAETGGIATPRTEDIAMNRVAVLLVATLSVALGAAAARAQEVQFAAAAVPGVAEAATIKGRVFKPAGNGPFPAIVLLHGCGGPGAHHQAWAEKLASWGYVALVADSFGSRGKSGVCQNPMAVPPPARVADVAGAARFLATQLYVARDRLAVIGFSHGGWTALKGAQASGDWAALGIRSVVAYYPYCTAPADRRIALPFLILIGDKDDWTPADRCRALMQDLEKPALVEVVYYPDATHAFDLAQPTSWVQGVGSDGRTTARKLEYDRGAARDAEARTRAFFERTLR